MSNPSFVFLNGTVLLLKVVCLASNCNSLVPCYVTLVKCMLEVVISHPYIGRMLCDELVYSLHMYKYSWGRLNSVLSALFLNNLPFIQKSLSYNLNSFKHKFELMENFNAYFFLVFGLF